jgi:hypothetical protein
MRKSPRVQHRRAIGFIPDQPGDSHTPEYLLSQALLPNLRQGIDVGIFSDGNLTPPHARASVTDPQLMSFALDLRN